MAFFPQSLLRGEVDWIHAAWKARAGSWDEGAAHVRAYQTQCAALGPVRQAGEGSGGAHVMKHHKKRGHKKNE